jgi:hypothetical protein
MWDSGPIEICAYKYIQNMYPKVGLIERSREELKKERKILNDNETHLKQDTMKHTKNC